MLKKKEYLPSDLWNIVFKYCWPDTDDFNESCIYGHYEKIARLEDESWNIALGLVCRYGYTSMIDLIISKVIQLYKNENILDWNIGLEDACAGGILKLLN